MSNWSGKVICLTFLLGSTIALFIWASHIRPLQNYFIDSIINGDTTRVKFLIALHINLNKPGTRVLNGPRHDSWTPLTAAAHKSQIGIGTLLLNAGADIEGRDGSGRTALLMAAVSGNIQFAQMLLGRGADPLARENKYSHNSAMDHAFNQKRVDLISLLLDHEVPLPQRFQEGNWHDESFRREVNMLLDHTKARERGLVPIYRTQLVPNRYHIATCKLGGRWIYSDWEFYITDAPVLFGESTFIDDLIRVLPNQTKCFTVRIEAEQRSTLRGLSKYVESPLPGIYLDGEHFYSYAIGVLRHRQHNSFYYSIQERNAEAPLSATLFLHFNTVPKRILISATSQ